MSANGNSSDARQEKKNDADVGLESRTSVRRLVQDIKEVALDATLADQGIHYEHDMDDYMHGHAMVVGPRDTPYEDAYYYFHFTFPTNYPYAPPKVVMLNRTREDVRLNPNLYVNGKVCLSILNTWRGEPWSACQTIRSVLLTLVTILNEKPLMNEPGVPETYPDHDVYNYVVQYASLHDCTLLPMERLNRGAPLEHEALFSDAMRAHFLSARARIAARLERLHSSALDEGHATDKDTARERRKKDEKGEKDEKGVVVKRVRVYDIRVAIRWADTVRLFESVQKVATSYSDETV